MLFIFDFSVASACVCNASPPAAYLLYPRVDELEVIPSSAHIWIGIRDSARAFSGAAPVEILVNGRPVDFDVDRTQGWNTDFLEVSPREPFDQDAQVHVFYGTLPLGEFLASGAVDTEPPDWDGSWTYSAIQLSGSTCGDVATQQYDFEGVSDDRDPPTSLLWLIEPTRGRASSLVQTGQMAYVQWIDECGGNDESLINHFKRSYDVTVVDGSGNRGPSHRVRSGDGSCGCSQTRGGWMGWALLLLFAIVRGRR